MTLLLLILFITAKPEPVVQSCIASEPEEVLLTGRMRRRTFAGPPNYESLAKGDQPERVWLFHLTKPICVTARGDWEEKNISNLQLVFPGAQKDYTRYRPLLGRRVTIKGTLFRAQTGHHHTNVLLTVRNISARTRP